MTPPSEKSSPPADHSSSDDAIETAAAEWLVERDAGFAPGRASAFAAWCAADPRHEAAVLRTEYALDLIGEMPAIRAPLAARLAEETKIVRPAFFRVPGWSAGLAAATPQTRPEIGVVDASAHPLSVVQLFQNVDGVVCLLAQDKEDVYRVQPS